MSFATQKDAISIQHAKNQFEIEFKQYVLGVQISTLGIQQTVHNFTLLEGENWSDYCLDIQLGIALPEVVSKLLPGIFLEFRVFYRVDPSPVTDGDTAIICAEDMSMCPDGTAVSRTGPKCEFICPKNTSEPLGGLTFQQVQQILLDYSNYYALTVPYADYVDDVDTSTLEKQSAMHEISLLPQESWSDYCLVVRMSEPPPNTTVFPEVYKGLRVFYDFGSVIVCTMEAEICPDGTYVGREGPLCEFSPCPPSEAAYSTSVISVPLFFVVGICLTVCCCWCRRRRCRSCKCRANTQCGRADAFQQVPQEEPCAVPLPMPDPDAYPGQFQPSAQQPMFAHPQPAQYMVAIPMPLPPNVMINSDMQQHPVMVIPQGPVVYMPARSQHQQL